MGYGSASVSLFSFYNSSQCSLDFRPTTWPFFSESTTISHTSNSFALGFLVMHIYLTLACLSHVTTACVTEPGFCRLLQRQADSKANLVRQVLVVRNEVYLRAGISRRWTFPSP